MSHYRDHAGSGYQGQPLYAAQYLSDDDGRAFDDAVRSRVERGGPGSPRDLDEVGHEVKVRHVPDFWKPFEEWTLD